MLSPTIDNSGKTASDIPQPLLTVNNLKVHFELRQGFLKGKPSVVKAVDGVDFSLMPGCTLALVGESGCGKTTLGRAVLRLIEPSQGTIFYRNCDLMTISERDLRALRREMQIIFQDPYSSLNPRKRVLDIIGEPLIIHKMATRSTLEEKVIPLLEKVGLPLDTLHRFPNEFSGGQRQRISIARAIALQPTFILCDEPVSALDVSIQAQIINLLTNLQQSMGLSYLFISHDLAVVRNISDRVMVMYLGKIVEEGPTEQIFTFPKHPYTRVLIESIPRIGEKKFSNPISGDTPSPMNPPSGCPFHPRCPQARRECSATEPPIRNNGPEHWYRCIL
ncbi:MAG: peptide ABC transporter substrate-binding protein [Candidatus Wallbacteria bacterium HGW-Wallbacteria-1]|jgi:oligopeptide transport system ATP-binding protein|uniref:Peptide ABC transporter substrate-binding protein n=1 Tax=Candidatus Wallbacteria bacterium HGW-Wallbacteria-1 TaxID=2013854 RepID=A0A2N1PT72_9BACT|nr:MAG: peptide ABC transporter substrate-binding protein [Candidatus Wallbacteria bacterium HGW-Wallbacteria-1]